MPQNHSQYDIKIGNVSPEQWTFHKFSFTGSHEPHLKFKFRVFRWVTLKAPLRALRFAPPALRCARVF